MREPAPLEKIPVTLERTGFLLEHAVSNEFKNSGWSSISGRYYLDDVDGRARELDMVVYKVARLKEIEVVTAVLVSCKKDEEQTWSFLSRDRPSKDPNADWKPVHYWTDVEPLHTFLRNTPWKDDYIATCDPEAIPLFEANRDIFAYQLISPDGMKPKNQAPIFDSVSGLMKALDHEITALSDRVSGRGRIYQFTVCTVVDAPLVEVRYQGMQASPQTVGELTYFARYMVRKREFSALIHFVRRDRIGNFIRQLDCLYESNKTAFSNMFNASYASISKVPQVLNYFSNIVGEKLRLELSILGMPMGIPWKSIRKVDLEIWGETLHVEITADEDVIERIKADDECQAEVKKILEKKMRYTGPFEISERIPF